MRRRSRSGSSRLHRALVAVATLALAALAGACGDGGASTTPTSTQSASPSVSPSATPTSTASATTRVSVYFLRGEKLGVAERRVPRTTGVADAALRELCAGPTDEERKAGLGTTVPDGAELRSVSIRDGVALVDFTSGFAAGGGSLSMMARIAQVVYTATQFPSVHAVSFALDGEPISELGGEGIAVSPPQERADWVEFEPAIFVEQPGVGAVLTSPFLLRGTASVFEGSFLAELRDNSGRRVVRVVIQASEGAPGRGDFRKIVPYTTSATEGVLVVYAVSMEDGSRQNEVRIPVTFAR